jgi:tetratricopeptide (TPR) repeat protein
MRFVERVVFTDAAGRQLTTGDLEGFTGRVRWEMAGGDPVPAQAAALLEQARAAGGQGDYALALTLLDQARAAAPGWPYPVYDAAYIHLLHGDAATAEQLYALVDTMAPRGFYSCKTSLDCLRRERAGGLFAGFCQAYAALEWLDPAWKKTILERIVARYPSFALAWSDLADLATSDDARLDAIEQGLRGDPDRDTRARLLISKASLLSRRGDRDTAIAILGDLALSPESGLLAEHLAKASLALLIRD